MSARLASVLAAVSLWSGCGGAPDEERDEDPLPAPVEVAEARAGALVLERTYLGMVRAISRAALAAGGEGAVTEVSVREGDRVEAGAVLVQIDPDLASAELRAAEAAARRSRAERAQASRDAERFAAAGATSVAEVEIERAVANAAALEAQARGSTADVARARATMARHRVSAPFAGVIAARHVDVGDWVTPGTPVLELVTEGQTEILVHVEPALIDDVDVGTEAQLTRGGRSASARVAGVVRALDPTTRTAVLRLRSEDAPWLLPGSAVDVRFRLTHEGEGVVVPRDALVVGLAQTRIMKIVDGQAVNVSVEVVERGVEQVRVRAEDLSPGDTVIVRGNDRLRPGQSVRVVE